MLRLVMLKMGSMVFSHRVWENNHKGSSGITLEGCSGAES